MGKSGDPKIFVPARSHREFCAAAAHPAPLHEAAAAAAAAATAISVEFIE